MEKTTKTEQPTNSISQFNKSELFLELAELSKQTLIGSNNNQI